MKASPHDQLALVTLQEHDTGIAQRRGERAKMPQLAQLAEVTAALSALGARLVEATGVTEDLTTEMTRLESDRRVATERLARDTNLLQNSSNPKDIAGLEHEIETLTRRTSELDDAELQVLESVERAQADLDAVIDELAVVTAQRVALEEQLGQREAELDTEIANMTRLRNDIANGLPAEVMALYEKQRERYGIGAGLLINGVSVATGMLLSESDIDIIRHAESDDVLLCPDSNCILVRQSNTEASA